MTHPRSDYSANKLDRPPGESTVDFRGARHAEELRALGQALEAHGRFVSLEIEVQGSGYWVRAELDENSETEQSLANTIKRTFRSLIQSDPRIIELYYSAEEIQELIQNGQAQRWDSNVAPDHHNLSQVLRTVGAYIDQLGQTTLIGIFVKGRRITMRYSEIKESTQDIELFYNKSVSMYLHRTTRLNPL